MFQSIEEEMPHVAKESCTFFLPVHETAPDKTPKQMEGGCVAWVPVPPLPNNVLPTITCIGVDHQIKLNLIPFHWL